MGLTTRRKAPATRVGVRRPWKVFVRDIGPTFSFATPIRAHARAAELVGEFAEVLVYSTEGERRRTVYRYDRPARDEVFEEGQWR